MINTLLIPITVFILMVIVGTGLTTQRFAMVLRFPWQLLGAILFQSLVLPLAAISIILLMKPPLELAMGLMLVAASPGGALSNYYCHLGRLDSALSVMLTIASSIASFFLMPLILAIVLSRLFQQGDIDIVVFDVIGQLIVMLLIPVVIGMLLKHFFTAWVEATAMQVRRASLLLVVALLAMILVDQWATTRRILVDAVWLTALFSLLTLSAGWLFGRLAKMSANHRQVLAIEFAVRNAGIAAVIAATQLGRPEFAAFSALFVVFQFPLILLLIYRQRLASGRVVTN